MRGWTPLGSQIETMSREQEEPSDSLQPVADPVPAQLRAELQGNSLRGKRLTRWLPLVANVGALIGLLLVVVQLQQNRDLMRAQIRHELAMGIVELLNSPAGNSQLASVLRRGALGDQLNPDEEFQFHLRSNALLRYWENVHYQYRQGLYDEVEFSKQKEAWGATLATSVALVAYWCEVRTLYSPLFMSELDGLLDTRKCGAA